MKTELTEQEQNNFNENLFFRNIESANPNAQKLANELKNRNRTQDYLRQFALKYGYPIWDKSKILPAKLPGQSSNFSKEDDSVIIVPVLHPEIKEVRTYVEASIKDFTILAVHTANEYQKLKFGADEKEMIGEAERHAIRFMTLNMDVFNYTTFNISDKRLFHGAGDYKDTPHIQKKLKLYKKETSSSANFTGTPQDNLYYHQICVDIITTTPSYHCTNTGACAGGICDNCDLCVSSSTTTTSICESWWDDGGGSGGDPGGTTTGGTSGGGGTTGSTPPCTGAGTLPVNGREMPCGNNEPGGWTPIPDEPPLAIQHINHNVTNPCIAEVYDRITSDEYRNELSDMIRTFTASNTVNITINDVTTLPNDVFGQAYGTGGDNYIIELNANVLPKTSQEWMAVIYYHEVIHVYIKNHLSEYDFMNNSDHKIMYELYFDKLVNALKEVYPSVTDRQARCIVYYGMDAADNDGSSAVNQAVYQQMKVLRRNSIIRRYPDLSDVSDINAVAELFSIDGPSGTRNPNCN